MGSNHHILGRACPSPEEDPSPLLIRPAGAPSLSQPPSRTRPSPAGSPGPCPQPALPDRPPHSVLQSLHIYSIYNMINIILHMYHIYVISPYDSSPVRGDRPWSYFHHLGHAATPGSFVPPAAPKPASACSPDSLIKVIEQGPETLMTCPRCHSQMGTEPTLTHKWPGSRGSFPSHWPTGPRTPQPPPPASYWPILRGPLQTESLASWEADGETATCLKDLSLLTSSSFLRLWLCASQASLLNDPPSKPGQTGPRGQGGPGLHSLTKLPGENGRERGRGGGGQRFWGSL